jgi:hypothetical protein
MMLCGALAEFLLIFHFSSGGGSRSYLPCRQSSRMGSCWYRCVPFSVSSFPSYLPNLIRPTSTPGTDFDGTVTLAHGIDDVTAYPSLIEAVLRRGATDAQVKKLLGENILRVWRENEIIAMRVQNLEGKKPIEDVWEGRRWTRWNNPLPVMIEGNRERIRARDYE